MNLKKIAFSILIVISWTACNPPAAHQAAPTGFHPAKDTTVIVDVRSPEEWINDGHANCSVNYPLDQLESHLTELMNYSHITFVCRSGGRAGQATQLLQDRGHTGVTNGGSWGNINCEN